MIFGYNNVIDIKSEVINTMIKALNIRLYPTEDQVHLMYKHIGCMRFVYNWALARQIENYKGNNKKLSVSELGKELTLLKNTEGYEWLYEVSNATLKESIRDLDKAYKSFFNGSGFPKFKSKKNQNLNFIVGMIKFISKKIL